MRTSATGRRLRAAFFTAVVLSLPAAAGATPGPAPGAPSVARAAVAPRDLPGARPDPLLAVLILPAGANWAVATRGALLPRVGRDDLVAREQGAGPALPPAWFEPDFVTEETVSADEIPFDTVTRGAVMPLRGADTEAWDGEGVGPTGRQRRGPLR